MVELDDFLHDKRGNRRTLQEVMYHFEKRLNEEDAEAIKSCMDC